MTNKLQVAALRRGSSFWNAWRVAHAEVPIDLAHADLSGLDLEGALLEGAFLTGADLTGSNFSSADLRKADLSKCVLSGTCLDSARLDYADLREATVRLGYAIWKAVSTGQDDRFARRVSGTRVMSRLPASFRGASLRSANLSNATFVESDFDSAILYDAILVGTTFDHVAFGECDVSNAELGNSSFVGSDLSRVRGLKRVNHRGPSYFDVETLRNGQGQLASQFLRGIGLSDLEIEFAALYDPSMAASDAVTVAYRLADLRMSAPIQINSVFISYSRVDAAFVDRLESALQDAGFRCWRDMRDLVSGRIEAQIERAIALNDTVVLVLSGDSVRSDWVEWEVTRARLREKESGLDVLCPLAIDDSWRTIRWPGPLRQQVEKYNILDFSNWVNDKEFEGQFQRLCAGLRRFYRRAT